MGSRNGYVDQLLRASAPPKDRHFANTLANASALTRESVEAAFAKMTAPRDVPMLPRSLWADDADQLLVRAYEWRRETLTPRLAVQLERDTGTPARVWMLLAAAYEVTSGEALEIEVAHG